MKKGGFWLLAIIAAVFFVPGLSTAGVSASWKNFIDRVMGAFGKNLTSIQRESVVEIVSAFDRYGDGDIRKLVYIIATAWHESRLQPIEEIRAAPGTQVYEIQNTYWESGYYGRGYVQITLKGNYEKMSNILGVDLVSKPDLALNPKYAARIMVQGMIGGLFTGKRLSDYINSIADYYNARKTVGAIMVAGRDTAAVIEGHVKTILKSLN